MGQAIAGLLAEGSAAESIAILCRTATVGLPFQSILKDLGIPFEVRGGADLWQSSAARLVVGSLTYLRDGDSPEAMSRLGAHKRAEIVLGQLDQIRGAVRGQFTVAATHVRRIVGDAVPARMPKREKAEWHAVVDAVVMLAHSCSSLKQLEDRIAEQSQSLRNPPPNAVMLSTIHSAKGLEWDMVFLVGVEDGVLPHANCEDIEEERRVAYVGMTRARRRLGLTYSAERFGERARPSPFLFEVGGKEQRHCIWTGPRSNGADERLPLVTDDERRRVFDIAARRVSRVKDPGARQQTPGAATCLPVSENTR